MNDQEAKKHVEKTLSHFSENNFASQLASIFEKLPKELEGELDIAQTHYMELIHITSGYFDENQLNDDRKKYKLFYDNSLGGERPIFTDSDCIAFMSERYRLPKLLCEMFITNDFNWIAASGCTESINETISDSCDRLKQSILNDELLLEMVSFFLNRGIRVTLPLDQMQ